MSYPIPKIIYDAGLGPVTIIPTYPNVAKPYLDDWESVRHDSITNSGIRQSVVERVDRIKPVQFDMVPWSDLGMWENFFNFAITGAGFIYYYDSTIVPSSTAQLVEDKIAASFVCIGFSKFSFHLRLVP